MRRSLYVRSVDVLQINFVALRCTASIYHPFHGNCSKNRLYVSFACIRKANAIETRSFVLEVVDKVDFQIKMQRYEFLLSSLTPLLR